MDLKEVYDVSKIKLPKTDGEFWLALLQVRNHYLAEAAAAYQEQRRRTGVFDDNHVWHTWLLLDHWLDRAFEEWWLAK